MSPIGSQIWKVNIIRVRVQHEEELPIHPTDLDTRRQHLERGSTSVESKRSDFVHHELDARPPGRGVCISGIDHDGTRRWCALEVDANASHYTVVEVVEAAKECFADFLVQ